MKLIGISLLLISNILAAPAYASPSHAVSLKWFDASGNLVDLDWPVRYRWVWRSSAGSPSTPVMQLSIAVPNQIQVSDSEDPDVRLLDSADSNGEDRQVLVIETRDRIVSKKIETSDDSGQSRTAGLLITVSSEHAEILVHESCRKEGLSLREKGSASQFFFVGATCAKSHGGMEVSILHSEDTKPGKLPAYGQRVGQGLKLRIPASAMKAAEAEGNGVLDTVSFAGGAPGSPNVEFELYMERLIAVPHASTSEGSTSSSSKSSARPKSAAPTSTTKSLDLLPTYFMYSTAGNGRDDASEFQLKATFRIAGRFFGPAAPPMEAEAYAPVVDLAGRPFHALAAGEYGVSGHLGVARGSVGKVWVFSLDPGLFAEAAHLEERPLDSFFHLGPSLNLSLADHPGVSGGQRVRIGVTAGFLGPVRTWVSAWGVSAEYALSVLAPISGDSFDIVTQIAFQRLEPAARGAVDTTAISVGIRLYE